MNYKAINYVRKYFKMNKLIFYSQMKKDNVDLIIYSICEELLGKDKEEQNTNSKNMLKQIVSGDKDKLIADTIDRYVKKTESKLWADYTNFKSYVENSIGGNEFIVYNDITFNCIVERIICSLSCGYDYKILNSGEYDEEISLLYVSIVGDLCNEMRDYIKKYIVKNIYPMNNINEVEISEIIVKDIMTSKKYNCFDLLMGKYDKLIVQYANQYKNNIEQNRPNSVEYIYQYIKENFDDIDDENELYLYANAIDDVLRSKYIFSEEIVSHEYDSNISQIYCGFMMRRNSVKQEDVPEKIEHKTKTIKIPLSLLKIIGATILSLVVVVPMGIKVVNDTKLDIANKTISKIDDFEYSRIHTIYTDGFRDTASNVLKFYDNFKDYGEGDYYNLGFYRAYESVKENRLAVMDRMLSIVKNEARKDKNYSEFSDFLSGYSCYLEFMCDRLYEMGFKKITDSKYYDAVSAYRGASFRANENQTPMDVLREEGQDEVIKTIYQISEEYIEYCNDAVINLAGIIEDAKDKSSGRTI